MTKIEEKIPEHISTYQHLKKKAKQMIDTTDKHHRQAYDYAQEKVLMKDGQVNHDLLDDTKKREQFGHAMADFYVNKIKQRHSFKDEMEEVILMRAYNGTTRGELVTLAKRLGQQFTFDKFNNELKPNLMDKLQETLNYASQEHFKDEHIEDIIKYTKSGHLVDSSKIRLREAIELLDIYEKQGIIPEKGIKDTLFYKKSKPKK